VLAALVCMGATCAPGEGGDPLSPDHLEEAVRLRALGLAEMENERYDLAAAHFEELAEALPDNILPPVNLAICYSRLNRPEDAIAQIEKAREIDPDNPSLLYTLARVLGTGQETRDEWLAVVHHFADVHPHDVRPYYLEAEALAREARFEEAIPLLERGLREEPENVVLLADLLVAGAVESKWEVVTDALNAIEDRLDGFDGSLASFAQEARGAARRQDSKAVRPAALVVRNLLRPGELYQVHLAPLVGGSTMGGGMFPQLDFDPALPASVQGGQDIDIQLVDNSASLPQAITNASLALVTRSAPNREGVVVAAAQEYLRWSPGEEDLVPLGIEAPEDGVALLHAFTDDDLVDLVTASTASGIRVSSGRKDGTFGEPKTIAEPDVEKAGYLSLTPLDIDHDGDLDLYIARRGAEDRYLQNNGDGSWTERAAELGIAGPPTDTGAARVADFDNDGDLDLLTTHVAERPRLYLNERTGRFRESGAAWGLAEAVDAHSAEIADFNNDGLFDLLLWGGAESAIFLNSGRDFSRRPLPEFSGSPWLAATVADFDNDGDVDVVATGDGESTRLIRNRRDEWTVDQVFQGEAELVRLLPADLDDDGDLDLLGERRGKGFSWWRNDGGNRNHWIRLVLQGRFDNNSKNNIEGLHCRIEVRSGGAFQTALGNGGVNHLGLGARRQAEVLRVVWTNGLSQLWQLVTADRTLVEEQMLKGSCPFLYTWNGERFEFVTDLMWKSPLGMVLADGSPAPHQSARDFVLVPTTALRPAGGDIWLQMTEELWETVYVDRQQLIAVDHPDAVRPVIDESFRPPPYPKTMPLHWVAQTVPPTSARDDRGRDVLSRVARRDDRHVDRLPLTRYQGLTEGHALELTFDGIPADEHLRLLLWGWTFPTDSSINVALSQNPSLGPDGPRLDVLDDDGTWRTLEPFIGFPAGKRKAVVIDLTGRLPAGSATIRIATSMQIYWDAASLAVGDPRPPARVTGLDPSTADLHYRGYSRMYRASDSGPHLYDYSQVSVGPRFRDMRGAFTRFGEVSELLQAEDDRYVVMNAGDEMTIRYDATALPDLPPGWTRSWVLYTDGWVKDADINTSRSQTVEPLPFHGQRSYPDPAASEHQSTSDHRDWLQRYQTRMVDDRPFRQAVR
jgi:tetratricopeptide (TPR) repeat protein